ncbi:MAG: PKD domain-containing protein [Thermoplasmata archaeon]|nr:MAG: PKD domain-containing protein [Thermoplasmata archaeon]
MRKRKKNGKIVGSFLMTALYMFLVLGLIVGFFPNLAAMRTEGLNNQLPVAFAISENREVFAGEFAVFNGSGSYDPDGFIVSYEWNFGDGDFDSGISALHSYMDPGTYNVTLIVTDNDCAIDIIIIIIIIIDPGTPPPCGNLPPVAVPEPRCQEIFIGDDAKFDGSASYDLDGCIVSYEWDFGDGNTASGVSPTHIYDAPGRYTVTLTVTDDDGASGFDFCAVAVHDDCPPPPNVNLPPVAVPEPRCQEVMVGEEALFDGSWSYDQDGFIVSYEWDFGDGSNASGVMTSHIYDAYGEYIVTLTVTDDDGASTHDYCVVKVFAEKPPPCINIPPVAVAQPECVEITINESVVFNGSASYDPDGIIVSYVWDFGDGTTGFGPLVEHLYNIPGYYAVVLNVMDDDNATGTAISYVYVKEPNNEEPRENIPPTAVAQPKSQEIFTGEYAKLDGSESFDEDGDIVSHLWTPQWGTIFCGQMVSIPFEKPGTYTVMLIVEDDLGAVGTDTVTIEVVDPQPSIKPDLGENGGDLEIDKPDIVDDLTDDQEPLLILTAGLINIATFREGVQRSVPVEVTSYHGDVHKVHIELIDDGGLDIEVIPVFKNIREGQIVRFYLRITVPDLPDDTSSMGITLQLKAVGIETESNVEHIDILISEKSTAEEQDTVQTAATVGTISAAGILGLLAKRRFL